MPDESASSKRKPRAGRNEANGSMAGAYSNFDKFAQTDQELDLMPVPRFRIRSLMILVLMTALLMGAGLWITRLNWNEIHDLKPRIFLLGSFFLLVVAKLGLLIGLRAGRRQVGRQFEPELKADPGRETPFS
jgi:hypothetical protein